MPNWATSNCFYVWIWGWGSGLAGWRDKGRKERCQSGPVLILTLPLPSPFPFPEGGRHACAWLGYWLALKSYDERRWRPASVKAAAGAGAARQRTRPRSETARSGRTATGSRGMSPESRRGGPTAAARGGRRWPWPWEVDERWSLRAADVRLPRRALYPPPPLMKNGLGDL